MRQIRGAKDGVSGAKEGWISEIEIRGGANIKQVEMFLCERIFLRRSDFGVGMVWPWYTHCLGVSRQKSNPPRIRLARGRIKTPRRRRGAWK
jgi:hypothetical protein